MLTSRQPHSLGTADSAHVCQQSECRSWPQKFFIWTHYVHPSVPAHVCPFIPDFRTLWPLHLRILHTGTLWQGHSYHHECHGHRDWEGEGGIGGFTSFSTVKVISKTGLADGESRHLGMEDQNLPTIPPSHSILTPGRPVLALCPIVRRLTGR